MFEWLAPDIVLPSLLNLDRALLHARSVRGLILDLDNTLVPYGEASVSRDIVEHVRGLVSDGVSAVILSNARRGRTADVARQIGLPHIGNAGKPGIRGFREAMRLLGTGNAHTAVVGDQIFRDILGARRAGCLAILVRPLSRRDFPGTTLLRAPEAYFVGYLRRRGKWPE